MQEAGAERGYLRERFRLFHITDQRELLADWHYHAFDKLIFFGAGRVDYAIESEGFRPRAGDVLLIARGQLHRVHAAGDMPYDRVILYLDSAYTAGLSRAEGGLGACFTRARTRGGRLLRLTEAQRAPLGQTLARLERAMADSAPHAAALREALLTELLIHINRVDAGASGGEAQADDKMTQAVAHIQAHLSEDLSCDTLAARLCMSRSSFQHRFRAATGYPPHAYIRLKRLLLAAELLQGGTPALAAGKACGWGDHSAFCHAFRAHYGVPPSRFTAEDALVGPRE